MTQLESIQQKFAPRMRGWYAAPAIKRCVKCGVIHAKDDLTRVCICGSKKFVDVQRAR